jgi:hypothetical protein
VSRIEIANAMRVAAEESGGMSREDLKRAALQIFGGRRMTEAIEARLESAVELAIERRHITTGPGGIFVAGPR